jgi:curli biogenesis system outer membrane secretion channel CsgG
MKKYRLPLVALTLVASALTTVIPSVMAAPQPIHIASGVEQINLKGKRRIAVLDFDFASVSESGYSLGLYGDEGGAKGISNLLTNKLVQNGNFIVVERSRIEAILAEQNLAVSGRIEPTTAVQIGRILGVDAVLLGSVTKFYVEDKSQGVSLGGFLGLGGNSKKQTATVQLTTRLVSTATGEILAVSEGNGKANASNQGGSVFGISSSSDGDSADRILGAAVEQAVDQVVGSLAASAPKLAALPGIVPTDSLVIADVSGDQVVLNKGGNEGFRPGMILTVERVLKEIKDPTTGQLLKRETQAIGRLQLTEVDAGVSTAKILSGTGFKVGDYAKAIQE